MQIDDRRIRFLYQSWRSGSMRAAGDVLDIAPSTISRQITQLEREVGVQLIERGRREIQLTEAGREVIEYYRDRQARQELLRSRILDLSAARVGHIRLALGEGFLGEALYSTLDTFMDRHSGFTIGVHVTDTTEMMRLLIDDDAHFGLGFHPLSDPNIVSRFRATVPLKAIMHAAHPLAARQCISVAELCAQPLAVMGQRFRIRQMLDLAATDCAQFIAPVLTTNSIALLIRTARVQRAVTVLPEFSVRGELLSGELVAVQIDSTYLQSLYVHLITRKHRQFSAPVKQLMAEMRRRLAPDTLYTPMGEQGD